MIVKIKKKMSSSTYGEEQGIENQWHRNVNQFNHEFGTAHCIQSIISEIRH